MKSTVNLHEFRDAFDRFDCGERRNTFTYEGLEALFNYLEAWEDGTGEELELDVIALYCDFCEYANLKEFQQNYSEDYATIEDISYATTVIPIDDERFIIHTQF